MLSKKLISCSLWGLLKNLIDGNSTDILSALFLTLNYSPSFRNSELLNDLKLFYISFVKPNEVFELIMSLARVRLVCVLFKSLASVILVEVLFRIEIVPIVEFSFSYRIFLGLRF
jgi:hypothetical protein